MSGRTLADKLRAVPESFPELGDDMLGRTAKWVILPQLVRLAEKSPEKFEHELVGFLRRFVSALELSPVEIFGVVSETVSEPPTN